MIEIRRLTYADLPAVVAVERRAFPTPWSLAMFVLELSKPAGVCLVALDDQEIVGYVICSRHDTVWHLMDIAVPPERRRQGIASALIRALLERLPGPDEQVTLEVRPSNDAGLRLYEGFGFKAAGVRRRYYQDNGEDAVIMWRTPGTRQGTLDDVPNGPPRRHPAVILALETSCDDTCAAVLDGDALLSNVVSSQGVHDRYGGVVPEIASRHHLELVNAVVDDALATAGATLDDIDLVALTQGPGLVGALLIGVATGKAIAAARGLPLAAVDHLHGHVAANFLGGFEPPFLCLVASGGHTLLARVEDHGPGFEVLGATLDDAAGEAFDKGARLLGLGFPGGPALSKLATQGDPAAYDFPTARKVAGLDFSFAGLKTALLYAVRDLDDVEPHRADLAAAYEHAIVSALMTRVERAIERTGLERVAIGGGVAANARLRERVQALGVEVHVPPRQLCTDNAAMIASAARYVEPVAYPHYLALDAYASA